ncbi:MAG: YlxR family protein [Pseudomonadota bacterium]
MGARADGGPLRTCVACGRRRPQAELLRLAWVQDRVEPDPPRRLAGRGAYVCRSADCARKLITGKGLRRAFRTAPPAQVWVRLAGRPEIARLLAAPEQVSD